MSLMRGSGQGGLCCKSRNGRLFRAGIALALFLALIVTGAIGACPTRAQSSTAQSSAGAPASLEVAWIKPHDPKSEGHRDNFARGRYTGRNVSVKTLIERAYGISDYQLFGVPGWVNSETFDIDAKVEDSAIPELQKLTPAQRTERIKLIFQAMLADRFNLKISHETKELPIYALVLGKNGPKLSATKLPPLGSERAASAAQQANRGSDVTGNGSDFTAVANGVTLAQLAAILAREPEVGGCVVQDQTGLSQEYDFTLRWTRENLSAPRGTETDAVVPADSSGPSLFSALQQQLGLRLEPKKGPVDTIVIEHVERPSGN
jgi:uncharacterized protein (TIGR03435 family)